MALRRTTIGWTEFTTNPLRARHRQTGDVGHWCLKISEGCTPCYSSAMQPWFFRMPEFRAANRTLVELFLDEQKLDDVVRRRKPATIFWCDMTDRCLDDYPLPWLRRCFEVMAATPRHVHQVLTKRPERLLSLRSALPWPPSLWLGVSVELPKYLWRVDVLRQLPAPHRFLSLEPLFAPLAGLTLAGIDCVIIGGVSGPKWKQYPPLDLAALTDVVAQCDAAGVRVFVKQDSGSRDGTQGRIPDALWRRKECPA